jgi:hypothetical protein
MLTALYLIAAAVALLILAAQIVGWWERRHRFEAPAGQPRLPQ